jgi:sec-independent protein translocase protein TatA
LLLVVALLLFGAKRLPEIGRSLGTGMREFKDSVTGKDDEPAQLPPAQQAAPPVAAAPPAQQTPVPPPDEQ